MSSTLVKVAEIENIDYISVEDMEVRYLYRLISYNSISKSYSVCGDLAGNRQTWYLPQGPVF